MSRLFCFATFILTSILGVSNLALGQAAGSLIWIEGESPASVVPAGFKTTVTAGPAAVISDGKWLTMAFEGGAVNASVPDAGIELHYNFDAAKAGDYAMWIHVGFELARAPFDWRLDGGAPVDVPRDTPTVDVQELGVWAPVAWMNLGQQSLAAGHHEITLHVHKTKNQAGKFDQWLFGIDAFCFASVPFHPDGAIKPGDKSWVTDADNAAAAQTFDVPATSDVAQASVSLKGQWQYAGDDEAIVQDRLGPTTALPDVQSLTWHAMAVPGDRNKLLPTEQYVHRYYLRTQMAVPQELSGHSFVLHIPSINMIATVFVNGQQCGWSKNTGAPWDCDVTKAIKTGQTNELQIAIKDSFYGVDMPEAGGHLQYRPFGFWRFGLTAHLDMPELGRYFTGIMFNEPTLVVGGAVYTSDVFAKPSVTKKELGLEVTLHNPGDQPVEAEVANEIQPLAGGAAEKTFAPVKVTVPPKEDATVTLNEGWANPRLWWPDDAQQYNVVTRLSVGGKAIDERKTKFGFREWTYDGPDFKLNGIPWHGFADINGTDIATLKKRGQTMVRVWSPDENTEKYLDDCDAQGMCVRRTAIFDGEGAAGFYTLSNPKLWDNYRRQMVAWIKAQRNHPSIFIWSIENEITFINGHVTGQDQLTTREIKKSFEIFNKVDPTRPEMTDGGNALLDESMPVHGGHYLEPAFNSFPEAIYDRAAYTHRQVWPIALPKPVLLGESAFLSGDTPTELATVGGPEAATGPAEARPARTTILRMLSEGYRWLGFSFHFWTPDEGDFYKAWSPTAVFCRQWDWTFNSGTVARTMGIFNDTRSIEPITYTSVLTFEGKEVARDSSTHQVAAGENEKFDVKLTMPAVTQRMEGEWSLTLSRAGQVVFQDVKNVSVLPPVKSVLQTSAIAAGTVAVFDPKGTATEFLHAAGVSITSLDNLKRIPEAAKVLIIGENALDLRTSTSSELSAWASVGKTLIVLEQKTPLKFQALPGDMESGQNHGCLTFAEDLTNPVFDGISQKDLSNWGPDNWTYQDAYLKPTSGGNSLVQCDDGLGNAAMVQMQAGKGIMLLSQLLIGEKIPNNAVAQRLLVNMVRYGLAYKLVYRETAVVADAGGQLRKALDSIGLQYDKPTDVLDAINKPGSIAVIDADSANLSKLASNITQARAFTDAGGWIILNQLGPEGLSDFDKLVGVDHIIRPFHAEKVTFASQLNPLTSGLPASNIVLGSGKRITTFAPGEFPDSNGYSYVVDLDDVAPFGTSSYGGWNNAVNGFTQKDGSWQLIQNMPPGDANVPITLPRPEKIEQVVWCSDTNYEGCTRIEVTINSKTYSFDTLPDGNEQTFTIPDQPTSNQIAIRIADWQHDPEKTKSQNGRELVGIDNIWIKVARPADFASKVKPILNIGAIVEYPQGKGGIVLCNVKFQDSEGNPANVVKKRTIIATLLRNLEARFSVGRSVIAGADLQFTPVDISKSVNQFRGEQGWFGDKKHTFEALPQGRQSLAGVSYDIYSFKTSIVPEAIMLQGRGVPGGLADKVTGIAVNQRADALFFLQAAHLEAHTDARELKAGKRYEMADYIIHYANGTVEKAPIYADINIGDYHQPTPTPLPGAQVAWQQAYGASDGYAVAYSMQWNNPHPDQEIASVDLVYGPQRRGVPALLAITAATAR